MPLPLPSPGFGQRLRHHQEELAARGLTLGQEIRRRYLDKWRSETLYHVSRIRTALVSGMTEHLVAQGLLNLERVSLSPVTDPLAHTVEGLPSIPYRGAEYVTTHSMIYAKFLACHNPHLKGIFVDSPNIRLEPPDPQGRQRGRYLIDFSQLDVEVRRDRGVDLARCLERPQEVEALLREDLAGALAFFEKLLRAGLERVQSLAGDSLAALGVRVEPPPGPFPVYELDEAQARLGRQDVEAALGEASPSPYFFIRGLMRENYDLIFPYLRPDGGRRPLGAFRSREIYNYDLCVRPLPREGGAGGAREVLSGGLREWLPEAIVGRLVDNGVIPGAPLVVEGEIRNLEAMGGYGPFLAVVHARDEAGRPCFPETFGGGIGIERLLWSLLEGPCIRSIDEVTFFGKNPDTSELFLF